MLGHFQASYLVIFSFRNGDITVVHAENLGLAFLDAIPSETSVTPSGLVAPESDTGNVSVVVDGSIPGKRAPAAANIKQTLTGLKLNLFTDNLHLVVLELFKALLLVNVRDDSRSVNHAGSEEPCIKIVTAVIVIADLFLICGSKTISINATRMGACNPSRGSLLTLRAGVQNNLRHHAGQKELEQRVGKFERSPIVSVLHNLEAVALEADFSSKVLLMECLHRDLVTSTIPGLVLRLVEVEIVLNWLSGMLNLFIFARGETGRNCPVSHKNRERCQEEKEDVGVKATSDLPFQIKWNTTKQAKQNLVGEVICAGTLSRQNVVFDGGGLVNWVSKLENSGLSQGKGNYIIQRRLGLRIPR